jgi:inward rectifier potassium channel
MPAAMDGIPKGARGTRQPQGYMFWVVGDERQVLRDAYHSFLRAPWLAAIGFIAALVLVVNVVFAAVYTGVGGIEHATPGSFWDAFVFSVQTLGTIGYGVMNPRTSGANTVMIVESITGIVVIAIVTGLVFAKFARATARIAFTSQAVITAFDGKPTLMFRLANRRSNVIVDAHLRVIASKLLVTAEGERFYKLFDVALVRDHQAGMRRGWTAMHVIDEQSPIHGMDAAAFAKAELELECSLVGVDDVTHQTVHIIHHYTDAQIRFGHRFADTLRALPNGDVLIDLRQFDVVVPDHTPRDSVAA